MDDNEVDTTKNIFIKVEKIFYNYIKYFADKQFKSINTCCNEEERIFLMKLEPIILCQYPDNSHLYNYIIIIYLYYALVLSEPCEDYLNETMLLSICNSLQISRHSYKFIIHLIYEIAVSELKYAKEIRKYLLFNEKINFLYENI